MVGNSRSDFELSQVESCNAAVVDQAPWGAAEIYYANDYQALL